MMALRQLTRRLRVNLIYDPTKSTLKKEAGIPKMENEQSMLPLTEPLI
jgi:hypothetical protein